MPRIKLPEPEHGRGAGALLEEGEYDFVVAKCIQTTAAKSGNTQFELQLKVGESTVYEYLTFTPNAAWKISQFLAGIGMFPEEQSTDEFDVEAEFLVGQTGRCYIGIESYTAANGEKRQSNKVKEFLFEDKPGGGW